ncbi:MAG: hypothetical protein HOM96_05940, partial [Rickettsiales bacterium]|nr:hypothetical protein [Rickettsiales bacterium]
MGKILHNVQDRKEPFDDDKKRLVNWIIGEIIKKLREQDDFKDYFPSEQEKGNIDISSDNSNIEIYLEKMKKYCLQGYGQKASEQDLTFLANSYAVIRLVVNRQIVSDTLIKEEFKRFNELRDSSKKQTLLKYSYALDAMGDTEQRFGELTSRRRNINAAYTTGAVVGSAIIAAGIVATAVSGGDSASCGSGSVSGGNIAPVSLGDIMNAANTGAEQTSGALKSAGAQVPGLFVTGGKAVDNVAEQTPGALSSMVRQQPSRMQMDLSGVGQPAGIAEACTSNGHSGSGGNGNIPLIYDVGNAQFYYGSSGKNKVADSKDTEKSAKSAMRILKKPESKTWQTQEIINKIASNLNQAFQEVEERVGSGNKANFIQNVIKFAQKYDGVGNAATHKKELEAQDIN